MFGLKGAQLIPLEFVYYGENESAVADKFDISLRKLSANIDFLSHYFDVLSQMQLQESFGITLKHRSSGTKETSDPENRILTVKSEESKDMERFEEPKVIKNP